MEVGLVLNKFDPAAGGVEQWTYQFSRSLISREYNVHIIASKFSENVELITPSVYQVNASGKVEFAHAAKDVIQNLNLDIVHDMGAGYYCDVLQLHSGAFEAGLHQNLIRIPKWKQPFKKILQKWLPRYHSFRTLAQLQYSQPNTQVIALSKMVERDLKHHYQVNDDQIHLIYNGVDIDRFKPIENFEDRTKIRTKLGVGENEIVFLIVAHNFELKGVPTLIKAAKSLIQKGHPIKVIVVGGKRIHKYVRKVTALEIENQIQFVGSIDDPSEYYSASDVYVQPTFYDPCSLVVLEALAAGLPVITSKYNGAGELITVGKEGYIINDPHDPQELAQYMEKLLSHTLRSQMGINARMLAEENTFEQNVDQFINLYESILSQKQSHLLKAA